MGFSIKDVAEQAGVSVSTVSRAFTRPELVSKVTRTKVLRIADDMNFSISRSAMVLKSGRALRVALLMSDHIRLWFSASIIEGLNQVFHANGYDLSIFQISSIEERREFFDMLPIRRNADAVIVASFDVDTEEISQLAKTDVPIIGINCVLPTSGFTAAVNIDDDQGSKLLARHLIGLGHRHIAYIRTDRAVTLHFSVQQRYESFAQACAQAGVELTTIVIAEGEDRIGRAMTELLTLPQMPTAIACQEDGIAIPLMFQLSRNRLRVPYDVSVVGYDDSFYAHDVGLTTVRQDPIAMAKAAAAKTLDLIGNGATDNPFEMFPAQLLVRSSTTEPRTDADRR